MKSVDVRRLDLNLLGVFDALMRERGVTRAASALGLGQPAVSHALARLRRLFDDPLLVRSGRALEPTARALALAAEIRPALARIEAAVRAAAAFDPATAEATFSVGLSDDLQIAVLPRLVRRLAAAAPGVTLTVRSTDYRRMAAMLDGGEIATAAGRLGPLPAAARRRSVGTVRYRVLRRDGDHGALDLDSYCAARHVLISAAGDPRGIVDDALDSLGVSRRIAMVLPQFAALPSVLAEGGLVATVPEHLAAALAGGRLRQDPLPFASPAYGIGVAWRAAVDRDPAEIWFRGLLAAALRDASMPASAGG